MNKGDLPWIEKYRPTKISDILFDNILRDKFNRIIEKKIYPNLILMGNPGVGKTSTLLAFTKQVCGKYYNEAVLELNASDNRGLDIVDKMIIHFCKKIVTDTEGNPIKKFIIFDEADNITPKAQYVISDLIDLFSQTTIFTFTCNDSTQIIESIQSKSLLIKFNKVNEINMFNRLKEICGIEKITIADEIIKEIIVNSEGDMRSALINLEVINKGLTDTDKKNYRSLMTNKIEKNLLDKLLLSLIEGEFHECIKYYKQIKQNGYSNIDIVFNLINHVKIVDIEEEVRIKLMERLSKTFVILNDKSETDVQMYGMFSYF
jgi:replication factor C subunit 2/4